MILFSLRNKTHIQWYLYLSAFFIMERINANFFLKEKRKESLTKCNEKKPKNILIHPNFIVSSDGRSFFLQSINNILL